MKKITGLDCIMLIDDDKAVNFFHEIIIKRSQLDVSIQKFTNAQHGLDYLEQKGKFETPDNYVLPGIIFLDINMPGMDGWDFLVEYKKLSYEKKARAVVSMLTTSLNPDDRKKAEGYEDVKDFIFKPLTVEKLEEIVNRYF